MKEKSVNSSVVVVLAEDIVFNDFNVLHELLISTFAYMDDRIDPPSSMHRLSVEGLREKARAETLILALSGAELVGCAYVCPKVGLCYVGKVAVREDHRGLGLGDRLIQKAGQVALRHDCNVLELETRVELLENHRYFERLGFLKCGENAHEGYNRPTSFLYRKLLG